MAIKKLIEVALPLEAINEASAREKSIRHGHPSTLHYWWARRPLATARAIIWSSLVDDPSSHPELFLTEEEQNKERLRLFSILEKLIIWENSNDNTILEEARKEMLRYTNGELPEFLDPFSGGGAIPLEAQRLGLKAHAHDLNPVAVMINKAMIEITTTFAGSFPVNPDLNNSLLKENNSWINTSGMAEDVRYYGRLLKEKALDRIGKLYPKVTLPSEEGKKEVNVIAWIWCRTVKCPNPMCGCQMPLVKSFCISKKKGNEAYIETKIVGKNISYEVKQGKVADNGTVSKNGAKCIFCNQSVDFTYIRNEGREHRLSNKMLAIVAEGKGKRVFLNTNDQHVEAANVVVDSDVLETDLPDKALGFRVQAYGMNKHRDLFTNRQIFMLDTFSDLLEEIKNEIEQDAIRVGLKNDGIGLCDKGYGAKAYSEAIAVYLAFAIDKLTDRNSALCSWINGTCDIRPIFARQAISMVWDYAEANPFSNSVGCWDNMIDWIVKAILSLNVKAGGEAEQMDAQEDTELRNVMVSTDPPYYDNIEYADLSDYYYVWLRRNLHSVYQELFKTVLVPKNGELVATPYRFNSREEAKKFFEEGMLVACNNIFKSSNNDIPVTIYYAYKQNDGDKKGVTASSGWETMLSAIIKSGFMITGTWPVKTERSGRARDNGSNALSSSIVLVCRKRDKNASVTTRRNMINVLKREMRTALQKLQTSNIAPVDMAQSAIGPGMAVFSRYSKVLEADGTPMSVRSALAIINEELDAYFNEQVGSMDSASRFCVDLYTQLGYNQIKYGEAEVLANAKGISIPALEKRGILYAKAGVLHLYERGELPTDVDAQESNIWLLTQQLTHIMSKDGIMGCAKAIVDMVGTNIENARDLAYRLYDLAEKKKWSEEAYAYNSLVVAWPDIQSSAAEMRRSRPQQQSLF